MIGSEREPIRLLLSNSNCVCSMFCRALPWLYLQLKPGATRLQSALVPWIPLTYYLYPKNHFEFAFSASIKSNSAIRILPFEVANYRWIREVIVSDLLSQSFQFKPGSHRWCPFYSAPEPWAMIFRCFSTLAKCQLDEKVAMVSLEALDQGGLWAVSAVSCTNNEQRHFRSC